MKPLALLLLLLPGMAWAIDVKMSWPAITTYDDGTPIEAGKAITYRLYHGNCGGTLTTGPNDIYSVTSIVRTNVSGTCLAYAVTAVVSGVESPQSPQATITIKTSTTPATPGVPTLSQQ